MKYGIQVYNQWCEMVIKQRRYSVIVLFMIWSFISLILSWIPHWILFHLFSYLFGGPTPMTKNINSTTTTTTNTIPESILTSSNTGISMNATLDTLIYQNIYHYITIFNWRTLWYPFIIPAVYALFLHIKSSHVFS